MYIPDSKNVHVVKRKIIKAAPLVHPQDRKKPLEVKIAKKNLQLLISTPRITSTNPCYFILKNQRKKNV